MLNTVTIKVSQCPFSEINVKIRVTDASMFVIQPKVVNGDTTWIQEEPYLRKDQGSDHTLEGRDKGRESMGKSI